MSRFRSRVLVVFLVLSCTGVVSSCDLPRETKPSVLVIAVEGLNFEMLSCDSDETNDRILANVRPFCEESVRFSHAFTPSTLSQSALSSLMTGLYPFDHGVHHNGREFLSARFHTLAEGALSRGYKTLFVSGGAPIWRRSGLAQGFEVFDDNIDVALGTYYRPASEVVKIATQWLDHEGANAPYFAVLYLSDLQFPQIATKTEEGEVREKSSAAQLEEVSDAVKTLVRGLKQKHKWNSTNVVLVGLNSLQHHENESEPLPLSLKSSSVQVTLFVKPARKEQDNVIQWAVDRNVSLVDVGRTMFDWLQLEAPKSSIAELEPESLSAAVTESEPNWREGRLILSESAWPEWLEKAGTRFAIRQNHFLYIGDAHPLIFNTLTDRMEVLPLKRSDPLWNSLNGQIMALAKKLNSQPWSGMPGPLVSQINAARQLWRAEEDPPPPTGHEPWVKWYLSRALQRRNWTELKRLATEVNEPVALYVASRNLGENAALPHNSCLRLLVPNHGEKKFSPNECEDEGALALHSWQTARNEEEKASLQDRFIRLYSLNRLDQEIGRLNYLNDLRWDVSLTLPSGPRIVDYVLSLKELEPLAKRVSALLSHKDLTL